MKAGIMNNSLRFSRKSMPTAYMKNSAVYLFGSFGDLGSNNQQAVEAIRDNTKKNGLGSIGRQSNTSGTTDMVGNLGWETLELGRKQIETTVLFKMFRKKRF